MKKIILSQKTFIAASCILLVFVVSFSPVAADRKSALSGDDSPCPITLLANKDFFPALVKVIDEAQSEIFISIFSFKAGVHKNSAPDRVLDHLAHAVQRGVQVKVILENSGNRHDQLTRQNLKTKVLLEAKGIKVYLDSPNKTTHTKLVVADRRQIILGSHNLTSSALRHNNEISVLIVNPDLALKVRNYMLTIIREAK